MGSRMRRLVLSIVTLALTATLIAGATFALFTDEVTFKNHLQAGTLDITLERTSLSYSKLDAEGFQYTETITTPADFSNTNQSEANIFEISDSTRIVPTSFFNAEMRISNHSTVAFNYWIKLDFIEGDATLAEQIKVTVTAAGGKSHSGIVSTDAEVGSSTNPVGTLKIGSQETFTVKVEFVDDKDNNLAKGKNVKFDLIVYAVQATK
ncbi:MAG: SipW-dependent-type signal peptide-containing protein [Clostridia bacterium]|nr:SipW-dependent-type signal peptide-containing protein [Clostridia bacterium]